MGFVNSIIDSQWVVVVSVSEWYDEIFQNWLFWYEILNLDMHTIVIAEDTATYEKYANFSAFTTMYFELEEVRFISSWTLFRYFLFPVFPLGNVQL